jgi:5'-3' exonuclease
MLKKTKKIFVVDSNWYIYRAFSVLKNKMHRPMEEALPYALLGMICNDAIAVGADYVIAAFDGPKVFRYKIYPEYKANRTGKIGIADSDAENAEDGTTDKDRMYACLPYVFQLFDKVGLSYYVPKIYEADDVLCSIARKYGGDYKVICGTQDKDAYQYLTDYVWLYDSSAKGKDGKKKPKWIRPKDAEKIKGVKIRQMVAYQTMIGDKGDNVQPIKDMSPAKVKKILKEHGSIKRWGLSHKDNARFLTVHSVKIALNRKLVTLVDTAYPPGDIAEWKLTKQKPKDRWLGAGYHELHNFMYPKTKGLF